jgi:hypothetical protein
MQSGKPTSAAVSLTETSAIAKCCNEASISQSKSDFSLSQKVAISSEQISQAASYLSLSVKN